MNPKQLVREGWDRVSLAYRRDDDSGDHDYAAWVHELCSSLPVAPRILDLGCGCGVPVGRLLAPRARLTGVDFSRVQIDRARRLLPDAEFICDDMCAVEFSPESFDAVVSFYAIIHVPLNEQPELFRRIAGWLPVGGRLMATLGARAWTGREHDWLGVAGATMSWSHADAATYRSWLSSAGFEIVRDSFVPEGNGGHQLFHAKRTV